MIRQPPIFYLLQDGYRPISRGPRKPQVEKTQASSAMPRFGEERRERGASSVFGTRKDQINMGRIVIIEMTVRIVVALASSSSRRRRRRRSSSSSSSSKDTMKLMVVILEIITADIRIKQGRLEGPREGGFQKPWFVGSSRLGGLLGLSVFGDTSFNKLLVDDVSLVSPSVSRTRRFFWTFHTLGGLAMRDSELSTTVVRGSLPVAGIPRCEE